MPLFIGFLAIILDQLVKIYVVSNMKLGESIPVVQDIFHLTYVLNPGAAFGILENHRWFFIAICVAILLGVAIFYKSIRRECAMFRYGLGLLLGSAVGNLIDRIQNGLVVDFLDFRIWPVFNIADIAICVGAVMLVVSLLNESWQDEHYKMGRIKTRRGGSTW